MKIRNLIADTTRRVVKGVASTGRDEFIKAGRSTYRQLVHGKSTSSQAPAENTHRTYNQLSAKGETKKFGLNLMSQVSGKKFTYQELQELQAANGGTGNSAHDQFRAKVNQFYKAHAQRTAQQKAADQKKVEQTKEQEFREAGQRNANLAPVGRDIKETRSDIKRTRPEIGKNFGAE